MDHELPERMSTLLSRIALGGLRPAFLQTDGAGGVCAWGGALAELGVPEPRAGMPAGELLVFLDGLLPMPEPMDIPAMEMPSGGHADVHLLPEGDGNVVLLLDVTETVRQRQLLQQRGVDLGILAGKLESRNAFIKRTFGRYLSDDVVERILEDPGGLSLAGETRKVTILMNDLRGFTSMCERLEPEQVVQLLNEYLGRMTDVILAHEGTIDEFIGDAILVIFGAPLARPDDARRAVACAVGMMLEMNGLNAWCSERGLPALEMGIGLNTGEVIVGNIGSERRLKYGVVGANVNLTSRIESYTVGGQILASERTVAEAGAGVRVRGGLEVSPKGVAAPITILDVGGIEGDDVADGLVLPERAERVVDLAAPVEVRVSVLHGKDVDGAERSARCVAVSREGALLEVEGEAIAPLTNLRLAISDDEGRPIPGDLYAKAVRHPAARGERTFVHFTSIPPLVEAGLEKLLR